jgi:hypothetical protein
MKSLTLTVFDCEIRIDCFDRNIKSLLLANYGCFKRALKSAVLHYYIDREPKSGRIVIVRNGFAPIVGSDDREFLFLFEKDMTIQLQKRRRDLYFLHAAALEFADKAVLLVAPSGGGKSTTTWGLLQHHGFRYLSDELAPIKLDGMEVLPYPHALCLKHHPPMPYRVPDLTLYTSRTMHIPAELLPGKIGNGPTPLAAIFFLHLSRQPRAPIIEPIGDAESAARLYANALNSLAHRGEGLDAAIEIARSNFCFQLTLGDLSATCALMKNTLRAIFDNRITDLAP